MTFRKLVNKNPGLNALRCFNIAMVAIASIFPQAMQNHPWFKDVCVEACGGVWQFLPDTHMTLVFFFQVICRLFSHVSSLSPVYMYMYIT